MSKIGLVIIDHGSKRREANDMIHDVVKSVQEQNPDIIVSGAHMELAEPTIEDGINKCLQKGAKEIFAQPFMLSPGRHVTKDIPEIVLEIAKKHPSIPIKIGSFLGLNKSIAKIILEEANL